MAITPLRSGVGRGFGYVIRTGRLLVSAADSKGNGRFSGRALCGPAGRRTGNG